MADSRSPWTVEGQLDRVGSLASATHSHDRRTRHIARVAAAFLGVAMLALLVAMVASVL